MCDGVVIICKVCKRAEQICKCKVGEEKSALLILTERVIELTDHIVEISNIIYYQQALKHQDWWLAKMIDADIFKIEKEEEE